MEGHARLQLGGDAAVQAENAAFAPVRREGDTDGVTGAFFEVFGESGAVDHLLAGQVRRFAGGARTNGVEGGLQGFLTNFFHFDGDSGRAAQPGGAHHRGVVAIVGGGHLQEDRVVILHHPTSPCAVRHAAARAGRDQRFHADILGTGGNGGPHHRRDQRVFVCAAANRRHSGAHTRIDIARRGGDFFHLCSRFHRAQRFDDASRIGNSAELRLQGFIDGNRQEPAAFIQPNALIEPAALLQHAHQKIHRVIAILVDGGV